MQRQTCSAEHNWIPAVTERIGPDVSIVGRETGVHERLLADVDPFEPGEEHILCIHVVVAFQQSTSPCRRLCSWRQSRLRRKTCTQVRVVMPIHEQRHQFELLQEKIAGYTDAIEGLVPQADELQCCCGSSSVRARACFEISRSLADVGEGSDPLKTETAGIECLAERKVHVVSAVGGSSEAADKSRVAVVTAQHRN